MRISRRTLCSLLPLAALPRRSHAEGASLSSAAFRFEDLPVTKNKRGDAQFRSIVKGKSPTGEQIEAHETVLEPGAAPHPPHTHDHSEFWLIREGTVELTLRGRKYELGPGSAGFAAGKEEHGVRNIGKVPAIYFVVAIGPTP
jgi:mannose-6-phosphate isomerase-like protein (cupin superfamily)